jgi:ATP-dependent Clp protease protease subunit
MNFNNIIKNFGLIILILNYFCNVYSQQIITLKKNNFISINDKINDKNVELWSKQMSKITSNPMYIYIDSPGGSVDAGLHFINNMNWYKKQDKIINCIAKSAYSMAFIIFQNCTNRYIILSSTLMQHQISLNGIKGPLNNLMNYFEMINKISLDLDNMVSNRLNMTLIDYRNKISNDWWIYGSLSIDIKVADELVIIGCDAELYELNTNNEETILEINENNEFEFKKVNKVKDLCPL